MDDALKKNVTCICSLLEQMKSPRVKAVVGVLQVSRSKALKKWKDLVSYVIRFYTE